MAHTQYPNWTIRGTQTLDDLYWITTRAGIETDRPWVHAITNTLSWLAGRSRAPITARLDQPVTKAHAEAEKWAALSNDPALPYTKICAQLGVEPLPANPNLELAFTTSVWKTLRWLLNEPNSPTPFDIPQRLPNGQVPTAEQRYNAAITAMGNRPLLAEERSALRRRFSREHARDQTLAHIIDDTRRGLAS